jgi:hypothetical protein
MSEAEQDLDIAIGHYAELLASNLHAQRAAHFPPDAKKVMRSLTSGEAAELLGVDHTYLRKLHREGKIADVETTAGSGKWEDRKEEMRDNLQGWAQAGFQISLNCLMKFDAKCIPNSSRSPLSFWEGAILCDLPCAMTLCMFSLCLLLPGLCKAGRAPFSGRELQSATCLGQGGSRFFSGGPDHIAF